MQVGHGHAVDHPNHIANVPGLPVCPDVVDHIRPTRHVAKVQHDVAFQMKKTRAGNRLGRDNLLFLRVGVTFLEDY